MGQLLTPLRLLVVGSNQGPGMIDLILVLGKAEVVKRINNGINLLN